MRRTSGVSGPSELSNRIIAVWVHCCSQALIMNQLLQFRGLEVDQRRHAWPMEILLNAFISTDVE